MRVSIIKHSLAGAGAERVMSYQLSYLKKGQEVVFVLQNDTLIYAILEDVPIYIFYLEKSKGDEPGVFKLVQLPWLAFKFAQLNKELKK